VAFAKPLNITFWCYLLVFGVFLSCLNFNKTLLFLTKLQLESFKRSVVGIVIAVLSQWFSQLVFRSCWLTSLTADLLQWISVVMETQVQLMRKT